MEEKLIQEIEKRLIRDKKFRKELTATLINDYIIDSKPISFKEIKKRTRDLIRYTAELELKEMFEEPEEVNEVLEN